MIFGSSFKNLIGWFIGQISYISMFHTSTFSRNDFRCDLFLPNFKMINIDFMSFVGKSRPLSLAFLS